MPASSPEARKAYQKAWYEANKSQWRCLQKKANRKLRQTAIRALGGSCQVCGFSDWRALEIDHIDGGGAQERKRIGNHGVLRKIVRGEIEGYQLLCGNCHAILTYERKQWNNGEPDACE